MTRNNKRPNPLLLSLLACLVWLGTPATGTSSDLSIAKTSVDVPFFSQTALKGEVDDQGKPYLLGNSNTSQLWEYGCGVASLAMIYRLYGVDTDVVSMNSSLRRTGGFSGPFLAWSKPEAFALAGTPWITGIERVNTGNPSRYRQRVDQELASGHPVIAFLGGLHYVVLTGKDQDGSYRANDPWEETSSTGQNILLQQNSLGLDFASISQFVFVYPSRNAPTNGIPVSGLVADKYYLLGGSRSSLGNPVSEEEPLSDTLYRIQRFEHGAIFLVERVAHALSGPVWTKYESDGGYDTYGLPRSDSYSYPINPTTVWQADFEYASIRWIEGSNQQDVDVLLPDRTWSAQYFANPDLSGTPIHQRLDADLLFDWEDGSPGPGLSSGEFSARWSGHIAVNFPIGWWYNFVIYSDSGVDISIDGQPVIAGVDGNKERHFRQHLGSGVHNVEIDYRHAAGKAHLKVAWSAWPATPVFAAEVVGPFERLPISVVEAGMVTNQPPNVQALVAQPVDPVIFDVIQPGEKAHLAVSVRNTGVISWEPAAGIELRSLDSTGDFLGGYQLTESVPPGEVTTWEVDQRATATPLTTVRFQMFAGDEPFGTATQAIIITLPEQLQGLEDQIREALEKQIQEWQGQAEQGFEDLQQQILEMIEQELQQQTQNLLDELRAQCQSISLTLGGLVLLGLYRKRGRR